MFWIIGIERECKVKHEDEEKEWNPNNVGGVGSWPRPKKRGTIDYLFCALKVKDAVSETSKFVKENFPPA